MLFGRFPIFQCRTPGKTLTRTNKEGSSSLLTSDKSGLGQTETNVAISLHHRELGESKGSRCIKRYACTRAPTLFQENDITLPGYDKVFASHWITDTEVVIGTKCNKVLILNTENTRCLEIPTPSGSISPHNLHYYSRTPRCRGIHSISVNDSNTILAVGAGHPIDISLYKLPTMEPLGTLMGHEDLVFSATFVTDDKLLSGSREGALCLWSISESLNNPTERYVNGTVMSNRPLAKYIDEDGKIRASKTNPYSNRTMYLGAGVIKQWDCEKFEESLTIPLVYTNETTCLTVEEHSDIWAVGSQSHITFLDPRISKPQLIIPSHDNGWGVRSLVFQEHVLTIGGGMGKITFFDIRAQKYILLQNSEKELSSTPTGMEKCYLQSGNGWLKRDSVYTQYFSGSQVRNAIYSMCYDSSGTRLFTAGGPIQLGLCGSYAATW